MLLSDPFTLLSEPLDFSGSNFCCASDGDSESDPFRCFCCLSTVSGVRETVLDQMCVASPMVVARAPSDSV
eukprot:8089854-Heterocapsa_arctica.AAC.1